MTTGALIGCVANSFMGVPLSAATATPEQAEVQALAARANLGDKQAELDLGIRFEEGRGVERNLGKAKSLYLLALDQVRYQTAYIPANGAVAAETTSIGQASLWPRSFEDIATYHPSRLQSLLRLCAIEGLTHGQGDCDEAGIVRLQNLARLESNFRQCRMSTNLGNAGGNPYSFIINSIDTGRRTETRNCVLAGSLRDRSARQDEFVWAMWLAIEHISRCRDMTTCDLEPIERFFSEASAVQLEDSLMFLAMREAVVPFSTPPFQVGSDWWSILCRSFRSKDIEPTTTEQTVCAAIDAVHKYKGRMRDGNSAN